MDGGLLTEDTAERRAINKVISSVILKQVSGQLVIVKITIENNNKWKKN